MRRSQQALGTRPQVKEQAGSSFRYPKQKSGVTENMYRKLMVLNSTTRSELLKILDVFDGAIPTIEIS
jgi:hypothetical protein